MRIAVVSSYVPRKCGIATYSRDLVEELVLQGEDVCVVLLEHPKFLFTYSEIVGHKIRQDKLQDYRRVALALNSARVDLVHIQHEFGLFGGEDGEYILDFASNLTKPLITTFHTVVSDPRPKQLHIVRSLTRQSSSVIVMKEVAKELLVKIYNVPEEKIAIIFHGVPGVDGISKQYARRRLGLDGDFILFSNNLISRNKGIEYTVQALPHLVARIPNLKYLVVGETHPVVKMREGEEYRKELESLVRSLGLQKHVVFTNRYVSLSNLQLFLAASDICVTSYVSLQQITSGTLSYAIGAGKACISTSYPYAEGILANGRGVLVPFRNSMTIEQAILDLYDNRKKMHLIEKRAFAFGKKMRWPVVAKKHKVLYKRLLDSQKTESTRSFSTVATAMTASAAP